MYNHYHHPVYGYVTKYTTITLKGKTVRIPIHKLGVVRYERKAGV